MGAQQQAPEAWGRQARITIPVMAASGGSGRSTVTGLIACSLAAVASTVVFDVAGNFASPWPSWVEGQGLGFSALPPDGPVAMSSVAAAVSRCSGPSGAWHVLTDHSPWHAPRVKLPSDPEAWRQLSSLGDWQAVVVDSVHLIAEDMASSTIYGRQDVTSLWCGLPQTVPVLAVMATGTGMAALQTAVLVGERRGLPLERTVIAVSEPSEGRSPATVRAILTMLERKVGSVVKVPYDPRIRSQGLQDPSRLRPQTLKAAQGLAAEISRLAHATWGYPLPPAARPRAHRPEGIDIRVPDAHHVAAGR